MIYSEYKWIEFFLFILFFIIFFHFKMLIRSLAKSVFQVDENNSNGF